MAEPRWQRALPEALKTLVCLQDAHKALTHLRACDDAPTRLSPMIRLNILLCDHMIDVETADADADAAGHRAWKRARTGLALIKDHPWYVPAYNLTAFILISSSRVRPDALGRAVELLEQAAAKGLHPQTFLLASAALMQANRCAQAAQAYARAAALGAGVPTTEHVVRAYCDTGDGELHLLHKGAATLLDTLYGDGIAEEGLLALHAACFEHITPAPCHPAAGSRVAFISEHLAPGSVLSNAGPFLRRMTDALVVDVGGKTSDITKHLRGQGRLLPPLEGVLRNANVGVVVCLDGCTGSLAALSFITKELPEGAAVVSAIGYAHPTCHPRVHYRLTDTLADPPSDPVVLPTSGRLLETPLYLDPCFLCWEPPGPPASLVPLTTPTSVFVANHNFKKLSPTTLALYARVLKACPDATLTLKPTSPLTPGQRGWIHTHPELSTLANDGRVIIEDAISDGGAYYAFLSRFKVCLDCTPYTGTVTTLEALWSDTAVVTLTGDVHRSRVTTSILHAIGRPQWCAADSDEYVKLAAQMAADPYRPGQVRSALMDSCILDHHAYTQRLRHCLDPAALTQATA